MQPARYLILLILRKFGLTKQFYRIYVFLRVFNPREFIRNQSFRRQHSGSQIPIPPIRLIVRVSGISSISSFLREGFLAVESMIGCLEKNGVKFAEFDSILDFGCGCGRVIRHLTWMDETLIVGTDSDAEAIEWCNKFVPQIEFQVNGTLPPLDSPDESFDFIYGLSVLTHMPEEYQRSWMSELWRVLKVGGYLLLSLRGLHYLPVLTSSELKEFSQGNVVVRFAEGAGSNLCNAYHPLVFVSRELGRDFDLVDHIPKGAKGNPYQDLYLFRKPDFTKGNP